jgi:hypothetical protein
MRGERSLGNTRRLKRMSRNVMAKFRDFERSRKSRELCPQCGKRGHYYERTLDGLAGVVQDIREQTVDPRAIELLGQLLGRLAALQAAVQAVCQSHRKMDHRIITKLLWQHRHAFAYLLSQSVPLSISYEKWADLALPAVALWDGRVNGLSLTSVRSISSTPKKRAPRRFRQALLPFVTSG